MTMTELEQLQDVAERLSDGSEEVRYKAVNELYAVDSPGTVQVLIAAVGDSSYRVREKALQKICSYPGEKIFPRLETYLRDGENADFRTAAMEAFPRYGKEATPYLLQLLKDYDEEIRTFATVMLGDIKDVSTVDSLLEVLEDTDENVRHAAAESLGKIRDTRAVEALIKCLEQDFWVKYPAIIALGNIGDPSATKSLAGLIDDEMLRLVVVEALGKIGDVSAIPVLADVISNQDVSIRNETIASFVKIQSRVQREIVPDGKPLPSIKKCLDNDELIKHLLDSLRSSDLEVLRNAVIALGWLKEERAIKPLIELLYDYELEEYVVGSIVSIGEAAISALIEGLENPDPRIKTSLLSCIGWMDNFEGIKACIPCLRDENPEVRLQALMVMSGSLHSREIEDAFVSMLSESDLDVRASLVDALGSSESPSLVDKLLHGLSGADIERKLISIRILERLKAPDVVDCLTRLQKDDPDDEVQREAALALKRLNSNK